MNCNEVLNELFGLSSEKYKANVIKMGIPEESSIGVSTADVRALASKLGKSNILADELWSTGYHEAKLLAVLVFDRKNISIDKIEQLMPEVLSWDLCDHLCKNLILKIRDYDVLIEKWCNHVETYYKRAAYTLIASSTIHDKALSEEKIDNYLGMIKNNSADEREHVKKAISWALREIGKKDFVCQEKAAILAYELKEAGNKAQVWVAKDVLKELEKLVQVEGRERLISYDTQMGGMLKPISE